MFGLRAPGVNIVYITSGPSVEEDGQHFIVQHSTRRAATPNAAIDALR